MQINSSGRERRFDGNPAPHYHVRCLKCGRIDDLVSEYYKSLEEVAATHYNYEILEYHLEFVGLCTTCQKKEKIMDKWECPCGYVYDPEEGDIENGIEPGTPFEDLPDNWVCPKCGAEKEYFVAVT